MALLRNTEDEEQDFFRNVRHIQVHRRMRAVVRAAIRWPSVCLHSVVANCSALPWYVQFIDFVPDSILPFLDLCSMIKISILRPSLLQWFRRCHSLCFALSFLFPTSRSCWKGMSSSVATYTCSLLGQPSTVHWGILWG